MNKIVVTAHCDVVWKAASIRVADGKYSGNLDNLVALSAMVSALPDLDPRIVFYSTTDEEDGMGGAKHVMKTEGRAIYVAIDATDAAVDSDVSVEWMQNLNEKELRKALAQIKGARIGFGKSDFDETHVYGKKHPTFSICLPIRGEMHGESSVSVSKVKRFGRIVNKILNKVLENYDEISKDLQKEKV